MKMAMMRGLANFFSVTGTFFLSPDFGGNGSSSGSGNIVDIPTIPCPCKECCEKGGGDCSDCWSENPVRYGDGAVHLQATDISAVIGGKPWEFRRNYGNTLAWVGTDQAGQGWVVGTQFAVARYATNHSAQIWTYQIVLDAEHQLWFERDPDTGDLVYPFSGDFSIDGPKYSYQTNKQRNFGRLLKNENRRRQ